MEALRAVIDKQKAAEIDVGNDGEQSHDGFFRYVKHRMTGFDGVWNRPAKADIERFPAFKRMRALQNAGRTGAIRALSPAANGPIRYMDAQIIRDECAKVDVAMREANQPFTEVFMNAPSPGIVATALGNLYYDTQKAYIAAIGAALKVEYEAIVAQGFILQIDAPDLALEAGVAFQDRSQSEFLAFAELVVDTINEALAHVPRNRVRMHVCWGNSDSPHDCDIPLATILPILKRANVVGGYVLPFASPAHMPMNSRNWERCRLTTTSTPSLPECGGFGYQCLSNTPEVIADRLERVARVVGDPRRVLAGTDCGFETVPGMSPGCRGRRRLGEARAALARECAPCIGSTVRASTHYATRSWQRIPNTLGGAGWIKQSGEIGTTSTTRTVRASWTGCIINTCRHWPLPRLLHGSPNMRANKRRHLNRLRPMVRSRSATQTRRSAMDANTSRSLARIRRACSSTRCFLTAKMPYFPTPTTIWHCGAACDALCLLSSSACSAAHRVLPKHLPFQAR